MTFHLPSPRLSLSCLVIQLGMSGALVAEEVGEVDFNRDIRPILSDKCFHCHGPDAKNQRSEFRVDSREQALKDLGGGQGIVPGDLKASELHHRIRLPNDDADVMPPLDSNRVLSRREKDLLDAWIQQGAKYDQHWAFKKPEKVALPEEEETHPIDVFIRRRLEQEGWSQLPRADRETRMRRAALSLTGLKPRPEMVELALAEGEAGSYRRFVDLLLESMDYAERQTLRWLDAARYADTDGFQNDAERRNWPWRDWVIQAFHENMPFDQFTIEQLAGDMLPNATDLQVLASAFNRNHRQNSEGGALAEEFFVENVIDRVETTSTVWLGLTMGCARCHDHKYDPVTQEEFFQLFAYFNNIGEKGTGKGLQANPVRSFSSPLVIPPPPLVKQLELAKRNRAKADREVNQRFQVWLKEIDAAPLVGAPLWVAHNQLISAEVVDAEGSLDRLRDGSWLFSGQNVANPTYELQLASRLELPMTGLRIDALPHPEFSQPRKLARSTNGNFVLTEVELVVVDSAGAPKRTVPIARAVAGYEQAGYPVSNTIDGHPGTGWAVFGKGVKAETVSAHFVLREPLTLGGGERLVVRMKHGSNFANHNVGRLRLHLSSHSFSTAPGRETLPEKVAMALDVDPELRSSRERTTILNFYRGIDEPLKQADRELRKAEQALVEVGAEMVPVMVMNEREGERTPAFLLDRGQYDAPDRSRELERALPACLFPGEAETQPKDRLELARWLVSEDNPLTARVIVNRIWQDHFGIGLVKTVEDFGSQGELPSHPELLDWLAVEFMKSGWDVKALHRLIVTSETFQQQSGGEPTLFQRDPENRLLARGPRYRLDGFVIRDVALQSAGLLSPKVGGAPVKPYQPEGLWNAVAGRSEIRYNLGAGQDLYRKSLYTYWKRAVNPPRQLIFDAGGREACNVAVRRTNTPLQALVLMNDETFLEAARHAAEQVLAQKGGDLQRLKALHRRVTALPLSEHGLNVLKENLEYFRRHYAEDTPSAEAFLSTGSSPRDESIGVTEHAAWTAVAHLLFNLDTSISLQ